MSISEQTKISTLNNTRKNYQYKVSIIVPCYNTKPWLDECLQSLVDQTLQQIEVICVNDGSTDGTGARLNEWQAQYPNKIKVIHQKNGGLSNARNAGMEIAQGECIGFVDSDDFVDVSMYDKLYKVLVGNSADVVKCDYLEFTHKISEKINVRNKALIKNINSFLDISHNLIILCSNLYKKKFLQRYNIHFVENIYFAEDEAFAYELAMHHPKLILLEVKLYYYRKQRKGQLTSNKKKNAYDLFKVFEYLQNKISNSKLDNITLINKILIRKQISIFALYAWNIQYKYKKDFLFQVASFIFESNKIYYIYKAMLFTRYRTPVNYLFAPIVVVLFHCCYLWQKISIKNFKQYFTKD